MPRRQAGDRYAGRRELASAEVAIADSSTWWDQTDPAAVARVYATAQAWKDTDPAFADTAQRVQTAVRDWYGPTVEAQLADAVIVGQAGITEELTGGQVRARRRAVETELATVLTGEARQNTAAAAVDVTDATTTPRPPEPPRPGGTPQNDATPLPPPSAPTPTPRQSTPASDSTDPEPSRRPLRLPA